MPTHPVRKNGVIVGYQWGQHGKIYHGKDAEKKANQQGAAAYAHGYKGPGHARRTLKR